MRYATLFAAAAVLLLCVACGVSADLQAQVRSIDCGTYGTLSSMDPGQYHTDQRSYVVFCPACPLALYVNDGGAPGPIALSTQAVVGSYPRYDRYTNLCGAAIHAGVLTQNQTGAFVATYMPPTFGYSSLGQPSNVSNGITSRAVQDSQYASGQTGRVVTFSPLHGGVSPSFPLGGALITAPAAPITCENFTSCDTCLPWSGALTSGLAGAALNCGWCSLNGTRGVLSAASYAQADYVVSVDARTRLPMQRCVSSAAACDAFAEQTADAGGGGATTRVYERNVTACATRAYDPCMAHADADGCSGAYGCGWCAPVDGAPAFCTTGDVNGPKSAAITKCSRGQSAGAAASWTYTQDACYDARHSFLMNNPNGWPASASRAFDAQCSSRTVANPGCGQCYLSGSAGTAETSTSYQCIGGTASGPSRPGVPCVSVTQSSTFGGAPTTTPGWTYAAEYDVCSQYYGRSCSTADNCLWCADVKDCRSGSLGSISSGSINGYNNPCPGTAYSQSSLERFCAFGMSLGERITGSCTACLQFGCFWCNTPGANNETGADGVCQKTGCILPKITVDLFNQCPDYSRASRDEPTTTFAVCFTLTVVAVLAVGIASRRYIAAGEKPLASPFGPEQPKDPKTGETIAPTESPAADYLTARSVRKVLRSWEINHPLVAAFYVPRTDGYGNVLRWTVLVVGLWTVWTSTFIAITCAMRPIYATLLSTMTQLVVQGPIEWLLKVSGRSGELNKQGEASDCAGCKKCCGIATAAGCFCIALLAFFIIFGLLVAGSVISFVDMGTVAITWASSWALSYLIDLVKFALLITIAPAGATLALDDYYYKYEKPLEDQEKANAAYRAGNTAATGGGGGGAVMMQPMGSPHSQHVVMPASPMSQHTRGTNMPPTQPVMVQPQQAQQSQPQPNVQMVDQYGNPLPPEQQQQLMMQMQQQQMPQQHMQMQPQMAIQQQPMQQQPMQPQGGMQFQPAGAAMAYQPAPQPLPAGWAGPFTSNTGHPYWFNQSTGESTYTMPGAAPAS